MNNNVLNFYLLANKLKDVVRTGWGEVKISSDRIESVADHVYGCLVLAIALDSENNLGLDMLKVFKMITVKELEKINLDKEFTPRDYPTKEERDAAARATVLKITEGLIKGQELVDLVDEYSKKETAEAKFVYQLTKIESDIQAKLYDLKGEFSLEAAKADAEYYPEDIKAEVLPQINNASDGWILYDRRYYTDDVFKSLSEDIQKLNK